MKKNILAKTLLTLLAASLFSGTAFAQLSLSADAKADSKDGAKADANADAKSDDTKEDEQIAPAIIPEEEPKGDDEQYSDPSVHDVDIAAEAKDGGIGTAGYDHGFFIKTNDDKFLLRIHGMAKLRFNYYNDEFAVIGDNGQPGTNHTNHATFSVPYARLHLSGHVFTKKLGYVLYYDFPTSNLIEGFATYTFIPKKLHLQMGLFKRPFSRVWLTSSVKNQFINFPTGDIYYSSTVNRPRGANGAGHAEDIGIQISNNFTKAKGLEWAVAIMNGSNSGAWNDFSPVLVGRIGYNNGIKGYALTDFEGGPFRFGVALSASTEFNHDSNGTTQHNVSIDGIIKWQGLSVNAAGYMQGNAGDFVWENNTMGRIGAFVQAGYLIKNFLEPVARYGMSHVAGIGDDIQEEITAGLTLHFIDNNHLKWENNVSLFTQREEDANFAGNMETHRDIQYISQLQLFF